MPEVLDHRYTGARPKGKAFSVRVFPLGLPGLVILIPGLWLTVCLILMFLHYHVLCSVSFADREHNLRLPLLLVVFAS